MRVKTKDLVNNFLTKFVRISKLAQSYASDIPLWSSIIFDAENDRLLYLGWRFNVEIPYPDVVGEKLSFIVNFDRFMQAMKLSKNPSITVEDDLVVVRGDKTTWELNDLDLDYTNYLAPTPDNLERRAVPETLNQDIKFCTLASSKDKMDYTKYGVVFAQDMIMAMDSNTSIALAETEGIVDIPVLVQLPWCTILEQLGSITTIGQEDVGQQNANMFIETDAGFKLTIPTMKMHPNPSIKPYLDSLEAHYNLLINLNIVKKLAITTDTAYKFATVYSEDDNVVLESNSRSKGRTVIPICEGSLGGESTTIALAQLKKIAETTGKLYLDLDNMVGFTKIEAAGYLYAFGLG
jgi:hypothetical protein